MKADGPRLDGAATSAGTEEGRAGRMLHLRRRTQELHPLPSIKKTGTDQQFFRGHWQRLLVSFFKIFYAARRGAGPSRFDL